MIRIKSISKWLILLGLSFMISSCNFGGKNYVSDEESYQSLWSVTQQASGMVFEDIDGNAIRDIGEEGISGIAVSNGEHVVLTNEKGEYELPVGKDHIIFVIKPANYLVPVNDKNLPQFYYIHKPEGSPKMEFPGVDPTGEIPEHIDFGLIPASHLENFTALVVSDPQPNNLNEVKHFENGVVSEILEADIDFALTIGDLVNNDLSLFKPYINATSKVGVPWYNALGNHDLNFDVREDRLSDESFEAHFGPANYAFNYGKVHFIVLDDILYPDPRDGKNYWGGFRQDQLTFIKNDLQFVPKDHLIVLAIHIPLGESDKDLFNEKDREQLFELLKDFPYTLSLSGHTHIQKHDFFTEKEGWKGESPHHSFNVGTVSEDSPSGTTDEKGIPKSLMKDGTPKGYVFIDFRGSQYQIRYKAVGEQKDKQMAIYIPEEIEKGNWDGERIYANFFMGTSQDQVRYRIDFGDWNSMSYLEDYDPVYMLSLNKENTKGEGTGKRKPSKPVKSTHLWKADIDAKLDKGAHTIEVEATDMFGQKHYEEKGFHIP